MRFESWKDSASATSPTLATANLSEIEYSLNTTGPVNQKIASPIITAAICVRMHAFNEPPM